MEPDLTAQEFEVRLVEALVTALPSDWQVVQRTGDVNLDFVVTSPQGTIFPVEVKAGSGALDVSTVVDFGAAISDRDEPGASGEWDSVETPHPIVPIIATSRQATRATAEYAQMLHVELVSPTNPEQPEYNPESMSLALAEHLQGYATRVD